MSATGEPRSSDRSQSGSTLIEALVVVTIVSTVAVIGFPPLQRSLLAFAQRQTVAVAAARLRQARADALGRDGPVTFSIAPDGRSYGAPGRGRVTAPPGVTLSTAGGPEGGIVFYGDGSSSGGEIIVRAGARPLTISVGASGGAVWTGPA